MRNDTDKTGARNAQEESAAGAPRARVRVPLSERFGLAVLLGGLLLATSGLWRGRQSEKRRAGARERVTG